MDDYIRASIREAEGKCHPETGHYATLTIGGIESLAEAREIVRALHRSALWLHKNAGLNCSVSAKPRKLPGGGYAVEFKAVDKDYARAYMVKQYGPDMSKWPYSPHRRHPNFDAPAKDS